MTSKYRIAEETDLNRIVEIYNQTIPTRMATADLEPVSIESRIPWFKAHNPQKRPLWVIEKNDQVIGWISLSDFYGRPAYEKTVELSIYIDHDHRGKHLGQQALSFVENQVAELEIEVILAFIFGHNEASLKLFKKNGFHTWGHFPAVAELDGVKRDLDILGKSYKEKLDEDAK